MVNFPFFYVTSLAVAVGSTGLYVNWLCVDIFHGCFTTWNRFDRSAGEPLFDGFTALRFIRGIQRFPHAEYYFVAVILLAKSLNSTEL